MWEVPTLKTTTVMNPRHIKLPRKRKKAFKKAHPKGHYMAIKVLAEILVEDGVEYGDRFYDLVLRKGRGDKRFSPFKNAYVAKKRW